jgi:maltose alpha-D-glucosyltransferase/alpha-amylase/(1->4)-alpha-D-glucan 1-alpha-D-glucosylmutase
MPSPPAVGADRPITATYRLQLRAGGLDLTRAVAAVDYIAALGASHLYLSPVLAAVPDSAHGYDVVDPTRVDDALGGEAALRELAAAAHARGVGLVLDVVPHHQAAHPANPAWWELLATGRHGPQAATFDVDWDPPLPAAVGQVVLPVLGAPLGEVAAAGGLAVEGDALVAHDAHRVPLAAGSPGAQRGWSALLAAQHYRLCHWRIGDAVVNYRRFLAVDELAAVRVERPEVFDHVMGLVAGLVAEGVADGLRVDHIDGLAEPGAFCARLRHAVGDGAWLLAEKILTADEAWPQGWPVAGGTGYDFLADALGLFVDPGAEGVFTELAREAQAWPADPSTLAQRAKREVLDTLLAADRDRVARALHRACAGDLAAADVTVDQTRAMVRETIAAVAVYRAYAVPGQPCPPVSARRIEAAVAAAAGRVAAVPEGAWRVLAACLRGERDDADGAEVCVRGQQLASAATAKGVEDTALYRQHRLVALAEVGAEPERFGHAPATFHERNAQRARRQPAGMLTTSTHDTKRGEDVRLRIAALTEMPRAWADAVRRWRAAHASLVTSTSAGPAPDPATQHLIYQTLVGVWAPRPVRATRESLTHRVGAYLVKATREAGWRTTHAQPDAAFEAGVTGFAAALLADDAFVAELDAIAGRANEVAMVASLAQVVLRSLSPGVPDTYQGCEGWEDSLVDPDNRRPVDLGHAAVELAAAEATDVGRLLATRGDGRIKRRVLAQCLRARQARRACAGADAGYTPLAVSGAWADHVVAFARTAPDGDALVVLAPRLPGRIMGADAAHDPGELGPPVGTTWGDTTVAVPEAMRGQQWTDCLGGPGAPAAAHWALCDVLATLPVALLAAKGGSP